MSTSSDLQAAILEVREALGVGDRKARRAALEQALTRARASWTEKFEERIGSLPWWMISMITHGAILIMVAILAVGSPPPEVEELIITPPPPALPTTDFQRSTRPAFVNERSLLASIDETLTPPGPDREPGEAAAVPCLDIPADMALRDAEPQAIGDVPVGTEVACSNLAVSTVLSSGEWTYIRGEGRGRLARRGGGAETLPHVDMALDWLARNQEIDGHWDSRKHGVTDKSRPAEVTDRSDTALALLAFLGSGHTPTHGKYRDNVRRAAIWLMRRQRADGAFFSETGGAARSAGYQHAICGLALAEVYGMTRDRAVGLAAQRAVDYSIRRHQTPYSGWRYDPRKGADLSVTGWFVMQLKSAKMAGLHVDGAGFLGAESFVSRTSDRSGRCSYRPGGRPSPTMTSVGLVCRQFMGMSARDPLVRGGAAYLRQHLPHGGSRADPKTFYYWYYGTLAMFQCGGRDWKAWNSAMKANLLSSQRKDGAERGSWDPQGNYDRIAGRVYTTAMGAMTLEVYYRYLQMYPR